MNSFRKYLFISFCILFIPLSGYAASYDYKITPRVIDKEVKQRDIFSETITVTNNEHHKLNLYASVNEVNIDEGGDIVGFTPPSMSDNTNTVTSWIAIKRGRIELSPGQTKEIPVEFKIHPEAESGVYHAFIGFGAANNKPTAEKQIINGTAPGVVVTLSVNQETTEFLKLSHFIIDRFVTETDNNAITYTLDNPGTANIVPKGEIIFYNGRGEEVDSVSVNPDSESLTPGQEATYTINAPTEGMFGKYKAFLSVDYGTAQLASVYDTTYFYVVPWQKLLILFATVLIFAILLTILLHRRYASDSLYDDGSEDVPFYIRNSVSDDKEHDINLK